LEKNVKGSMWKREKGVRRKMSRDELPKKGVEGEATREAGSAEVI